MVSLTELQIRQRVVRVVTVNVVDTLSLKQDPTHVLCHDITVLEHERILIGHREVRVCRIQADKNVAVRLLFVSPLYSLSPSVIPCRNPRPSQIELERHVGDAELSG